MPSDPTIADYALARDLLIGRPEVLVNRAAVKIAKHRVASVAAATKPAKKAKAAELAIEKTADAETERKRGNITKFRWKKDH